MSAIVDALKNARQAQGQQDVPSVEQASIATRKNPASSALPDGLNPIPAAVATLRNEGGSENTISDKVLGHFHDYFMALSGGTAFVYRKALDPDTNRKCLIRMTKAAFSDLHTDTIDVATRAVDESGKPIMKCMSMATLWLRLPEKPTYPLGITCDPTRTAPSGYFNCYQGFGVTAIEGTVAPTIDLMLSVLCAESRENFEYLIRWVAWVIQNPGAPAEVAVVLLGGRGIGKSTIGRLLVMLFGPHGMQITNMRHLIGNFNAHLQDTLFLFADEALSPQDRQANATMKGLITEPYLTVEQKGVDAYQVLNRLAIMIATNDERAIDAGTDERRFFVLSVSAKRQGNREYWAQYNAHLNNGGREAFLYYLLNFDLTGFDIRDVPQTDGLADQKLQSLDPLSAFLADVLESGHFPGGYGEWKESIPKRMFSSAVTDYCREHPRHRCNIPSERKIGQDLPKHIGVVEKRPSLGARDRLWVLPPLAEARAIFSAHNRLGADFWGDNE